MLLKSEVKGQNWNHAFLLFPHGNFIQFANMFSITPTDIFVFIDG